MGDLLWDDCLRGGWDFLLGDILLVGDCLLFIGLCDVLLVGDDLLWEEALLAGEDLLGRDLIC